MTKSRCIIRKHTFLPLVVASSTFIASDNLPPVYEESSPHPIFAHGNLNGVAPHELVVPDNGVAVFEEYCHDKGDLVVKELHELAFVGLSVKNGQ